MRPLLPTFLLIAVLATGALVAVDLAMLLPRPGDQQRHLIAPEASTGDARLIHAFYDTANRVMAGDGDQVLSTVAAPGALLHQDGSSPRTGSDQISAHFTALSRTGPLHFHITRIVADAKGYLVLIEVTHAKSRDSDSSERGPGDSWTTTDRIEVRDGLIAEYWPGSLPMPVIAPFPLVQLERIPPKSVSALARLELAPGTTMRALQIPAQQLLIVESGEITLESKGTLRVSHAGAPWQLEQNRADPADQRIFAPGDAVLAPSGGLRFSNRRPEPASLLSVLVVSRDDLYGPKHALSDDLLVAVAMHDPKRLASPSAWDSGVTSTALAVANLPDAAIALDIAVRNISVAPGQHCVACASLDTAIAIVSTGLLEVTHDKAANATPAPTSSARLLWPGNATTIDRSSPLGLENAGPSELTLSLIELFPGAALATPDVP